MKTFKIFISVGEESADLHASRLCHELKKHNPNIDLYGFGGDKLKAEGVRILFPLPEMALIGFVEVIKHLPTVFKLESMAKNCWLEEKPDLIIFVDFPGLHFRLAKIAHQMGIPIIYYIAPQAWAWKEGRVEIMQQWVKQLLVIFPFEEHFFQTRGVPTTYVGHPLVERIPLPEVQEDTESNPTRIGLLPGSRKNELRYLLPVMIQSAELLKQSLPHLTFTLILADTLPDKVLKAFDIPSFITVCRDKNYEHRRKLDFAWTGSGTATVENALLEIPMAVLFRSNPINIFLGRRFVKIPYIGMVNLIAEKGICPEFIQEQCKPEVLARHAYELLTKPARYQEMKEDLKKVRQRIGYQPASQLAADQIIAFLNNQS